MLTDLPSGGFKMTLSPVLGDMMRAANVCHTGVGTDPEFVLINAGSFLQRVSSTLLPPETPSKTRRLSDSNKATLP